MRTPCHLFGDDAEGEHSFKSCEFVAHRRWRCAFVQSLSYVGRDAVCGDTRGPRSAEVGEQVREACLGAAQRASAVHAVVVAQHLGEVRERGALHVGRDELAEAEFGLPAGEQLLGLPQARRVRGFAVGLPVDPVANPPEPARRTAEEVTEIASFPGHRSCLRVSVAPPPKAIHTWIDEQGGS